MLTGSMSCHIMLLGRFYYATTGNTLKLFAKTLFLNGKLSENVGICSANHNIYEKHPKSRKTSIITKNLSVMAAKLQQYI